MRNITQTIYSDSAQQFIRSFANHLLVVIAFFLPLNLNAVESGLFILTSLLLLNKNLLHELTISFSNKVMMSFIFLWLIHLIGITYAADQHRAIGYALEMKFLLYSIPIMIFLNQNFVFRILSAFIFGVFLSELLSYCYILEILTSPLPQILDGSPILSKYEPSPFTYHTEYGYILSVSSALLLERILSKTSLKEKTILSLFFITITLNVFFNSARTGYLLFFISNGSILLFHYKSMIFKKLHWIFAVLAIIIIVAFAVSQNLKREYQETFTSVKSIYNGDLHSSSLGSRIDYIIMGYRALLSANPYIGFGTDMHGETIYKQAILENKPDIVKYLTQTVPLSGRIFFVDCEYNSILLQFGLIGLFIYLNLFYQIVKFKQPDKTLNTIKMMLVISSFFYAFASSIFSGWLVPILFIFLISAAVSKTHIYPDTLIPSNINIKIFFAYALSALLLFILSIIT